MRFGFLLLGAACAAAPLHAQSATYRIRLYEPWSLRLSPVVRADLDRLRPDSLPLPTKHGTTMMVPRRDMIRIDSLVGTVARGPRVRHAALSGLIVGGIAGVAFGYLAYQPSAHGSFNSRPANALGGGVVIGVFGGLVGASLGAARSGDEWREVWPTH